MQNSNTKDVGYLQRFKFEIPIACTKVYFDFIAVCASCSLGVNLLGSLQTVASVRVSREKNFKQTKLWLRINLKDFLGLPMLLFQLSRNRFMLPQFSEYNFKNMKTLNWIVQRRVLRRLERIGVTYIEICMEYL